MSNHDIREVFMHVQCYLFFNGRCEEAIQFYRSALGAEITTLMRFRDAPEPCEPGMADAANADRIMHAELRIGETAIMASDGCCAGQPAFQGFSLALTAADEAEADRLFDALGDGGKVEMPLDRTFFSPRFGVVADRFGVSWMVVVQP
ncbi:MAG: VOC family protein [Ectothiorhodospiraceae bacterium]|jgi:PhnB protein|nr:VOC family protein [Ectothiorhodospiraceae bacterium]